MDEKLIDISIDYKSSDPDSLYRSAHAIKSMSANIGAEKVKTLSAQIESSGREGDLDNMARKIDKLTRAYHEFVGEFREEFID